MKDLWIVSILFNFNLLSCKSTLPEESGRKFTRHRMILLNYTIILQNYQNKKQPYTERKNTKQQKQGQQKQKQKQKSLSFNIPMLL